MCFFMKISWFFQFIFQIKILKTQWIYCCLKMIITFIMCTSKILTDSCFTKKKQINKKWFCRSCLQCFSSENVLTKHREDCLNINGKQSVRLKKGIIKFKNCFKQLPVPCKIYADFQCNLIDVESYEGSYTKNIKTTFLLVLLIKLFLLMINLANKLLFIEVKMLLMNLLKQFLTNINISEK